jgi:DNA-directed RNA polymerase subunit alpha
MRIRWRNLELPTRVECDKSTPTYGRFVIEPFERGFGTTIGNSLRRILLSSLEGSAVTDIRIAGVDHEFMTVPGMYEDVTEVALNVKQLLIKLQDDAPTTLKVTKEGKGAVYARDIQTDHRTEVVNGDLEIAHLVDDDAKFEMEMTVASGRGYVPADEHAGEDREIGVIYVDSLFSPVKRVRYNTENTRVGKITNYDKLTLDIWTDGTISPELALVEAGRILRKHLNPFVQFHAVNSPSAPIAAAPVSRPAPAPASGGNGGANPELLEKLQMPVSELKLGQRASNCLKAEDIATVGDLVRRTEADMLKVRNFGRTTLDEIKRKLDKLGLDFGTDVDSLPG